MKVSSKFIASCILFLLISSIDLYAAYFDLEFRYISKPVVVASLVFLSIYLLDFRIEKHYLLFVALGFAMLGDIFLLSHSTTNFLLGLGAFLVMNVLYAILFNKQKRIGVQRQIHKVLPFLLYGVWMNWYLSDVLGALKLPVLLYSIAICTTAITAMFRWNVRGYYWIVFGTLIFILSDSLIAINQFKTPIPHAAFWTMFTYVCAQFFIVFGYLKREL